ncbi:MAG: hypothetical protein M1831_006791 [Alyxoria varia]|nr:MAG: hypothetical protein M1831_006791 [Alyxoria varia]
MSSSTATADAKELPTQVLAGKHAIVTGASRGLGAVMALELARRGAKLTLCFSSRTSATKVDQLKTQIDALPNNATAITFQGDLSSATTPSQLIAQTQNHPTHSKIDIIINNAAIEAVKPAADITADDFANVYNTNVRAPILLLKEATPHLRAPARIINVSSVGARCGFSGLSLYTSSKAALEGLTRSWAAELGGDGTTVNAVAPGPVESDMLANIPQEIVQRQKDTTVSFV